MPRDFVSLVKSNKARIGPDGKAYVRCSTVLEGDEGLKYALARYTARAAESLCKQYKSTGDVDVLSFFTEDQLLAEARKLLQCDQDRGTLVNLFFDNVLEFGPFTDEESKSWLHDALEGCRVDNGDPTEYPWACSYSDCEGYVLAAARLQADMGLKSLGCQHRVFHDQLGYCADIDHLAIDKDGKKFLLELKTSNSPDRRHFFQLAAQWAALGDSSYTPVVAMLQRDDSGHRYRWLPVKPKELVPLLHKFKSLLDVCAYGRKAVPWECGPSVLVLRAPVKDEMGYPSARTKPILAKAIGAAL